MIPTAALNAVTPLPTQPPSQQGHKNWRPPSLSELF